LDINGIELQYQDEDLIQLILKIASGKADDRVLRTWVLAHIV
jgi:prophage maintenance system killer protein